MRSINKRKLNLLQRSLWISLAFFFLIFYSVPVKKYILYRIYKDYSLTVEDNGGILKNSPLSTIKFGFINKTEASFATHFAIEKSNPHNAGDFDFLNSGIGSQFTLIPSGNKPGDVQFISQFFLQRHQVPIYIRDCRLII